MLKPDFGRIGLGDDCEAVGDPQLQPGLEGLARPEEPTESDLIPLLSPGSLALPAAAAWLRRCAPSLCMRFSMSCRKFCCGPMTEPGRQTRSQPIISEVLTS